MYLLICTKRIYLSRQANDQLGSESKTALSDEEVIRKETQAEVVLLKYYHDHRDESNGNPMDSDSDSD